LSGCVGIAFVHPKVDEHDRFYLAARPSVLPTSAPNTTKTEATEHWGTPDKIEHVDAVRERWFYYNSLSWAGIIPMLILPIPMVIPTGHDYVELLFEGENAVKARTSQTGWSGFACRVFSDLGCGALH
jgi:hypothetical protein